MEPAAGTAAKFWRRSGPFRSYAERKTFLDARGLEDNRYQSAEAFTKD